MSTKRVRRCPTTKLTHEQIRCPALLATGSLPNARAASPYPPWRARPRTVTDTTLGRIRCPAFSRVFPKNRCEHAASGTSPDTKNFLAKASFTQRLPLYGTEPFLNRFLGEGGMAKFSKWKVPPTGGSTAP